MIVAAHRQYLAEFQDDSANRRLLLTTVANQFGSVGGIGAVQIITRLDCGRKMAKISAIKPPDSILAIGLICATLRECWFRAIKIFVNFY